MDKKIIIAEDDFGMRCRYLEVMKEFPNVDVDQVGDGSELVNMVKENNYDLIITDNSMPHMNGSEAIKKIREFDPKTPIYIISGDNYLGMFVEKIGANGFIDKMYGDSGLIKLIEDCLKK